jgi:chemotaxis signal transduction protein
MPPLAETPWVIIRLRAELYAIEARFTQEMLVTPTVNVLPQMPPYMRGVINLRGRVMPLMDLRMRLGLGSCLEDTAELVRLLEQREQDHRNWLAELEASITENRAFRLTTDPHACAFGKWYDSFHTEDLKLGGTLAAFDQPHKQIHGIALEARRMLDEGQQDQALELIERTRNGALSKMIVLFEQARVNVARREREIAVVLDVGAVNLVVTVDAVLAVETLESGSIQELPSVSGVEAGGMVSWLGQRQGGGGSVLILDAERLVGHGKQEVAA